MFELTILVLLTSFFVYVYVNERIIQKGKMPFAFKESQKDAL